MHVRQLFLNLFKKTDTSVVTNYRWSTPTKKIGEDDRLRLIFWVKKCRLCLLYKTKIRGFRAVAETSDRRHIEMFCYLMN